MRKRTLFAFTLAVLLVLFFSWDSLVSAGFQWYLKGYCRSCLQSSLSYESIKRENGTWILENPLLVSQDPLVDGGYRFEAKQIEVNTEFHPADGYLKFLVSFDAPQMEIGKGAGVLKRLMDRGGGSAFLFPIHMQFNATQGTLLLHPSKQQEAEAIPLYFAMNLMCTDVSKGCLSFSFDSPSEEHPFHAVLSEPEPQTYRWKVVMDEFNFHPLAAIVQGIWTEFPAVEATSGTLSGEFTITFPKEGKPYADGQVEGKDVLLSLSKSQCSLQIPNAQLTMHQKQMGSEAPSFETIGLLEIPGGASLLFRENEEQFWDVKDFGGSLSFKTGEGAHLKFAGNSLDGEKERHVTLTGNTGFSTQGLRSGSFRVLLQGHELYDQTVLQFTTRQLGDQWTFAEIEVLGLEKKELDFLKHLASMYNPIWDEIEIQRGHLDAAILVYLHQFKVGDLRVEHASVRDFSFKAKPWDVAGDIHEAGGTLSIDLSSQHPLQTLNLDLHVADGQLDLPDIGGHNALLRNFNTDFFVKKGKIQKSIVRGNYSGFDSMVVLDETPNTPLLSLELEGEIEEIRHFFPERALSGIDKKFANDIVKVVAVGNRKENGLEFSGDLSFEEPTSKNDKIAFGLVVEKNEGDETVSPYFVKEGWFSAKQLRLEKYLSPFLFLKDQMLLSGLGEFHGDFDEAGMTVRYDAKEMVLENEDFCIEVKHLAEGIAPEKRLIGEQKFDFAQGTTYGTMPIRAGTYFEKNSGLLFTDISTVVNMEELKAHVGALEGYCNGVHFGGVIDLDWSMPGDGVFVVDMDIQKMHGKFSQLQDFISHFNKNYFFLKIPLEGDVVLHRQCGKIHIDFELGDFHVDCRLEGNLSDAKVISSSDLRLQELGLNFAYDHKASTLDFTDLQGTILVGSAKHVEEYTLASDKIRFSDYAKNIADFDIAIGDKYRDVIRVAGKTTASEDAQGNPAIRLKLNHHLTHFGDIRPSTFEVSMKDWGRIDHIHTEFSFDLQHFLDDLKKFSRTGLFFLSKQMLQEVEKVQSANGIFSGDLTYNGDRSLLSYQIAAKDVGVGKYTFDKIVLIGTKVEDRWSIEQFQLDEISFAAELRKEKEDWNIHFLGATLGNCLALGMEGKYQGDTSQLQAKINLLELNLNEMESSEFLKPIVDEIPMLGNVRASGELKAQFKDENSKGIHIDFTANGSLRDASIKGLRLQDMEHVTFHYLTDVGFTISDLRTAFKSPKHATFQNALYLEKACCDFVNKEVRIDGLSFSIPSSSLSWLAENLQQSFPDAISPDIAEVISHLKPNGMFQGGLKLTLSKPYSSMVLTVQDGTYRVLDEDHTVSRFMLEYDTAGVRIGTEYRHKNNWYWVEGKSETPQFNKGRLEVSELAINAPIDPAPPLKIDWHIDPIHGYCVDRVQGTLSGVSCHLVCDENFVVNSNAHHLVGSVGVNMRRALKLLDPELAMKIASWEVGDGYQLQGQWRLQKNSSQPLADKLGFQGSFVGNQFELFGFRFYSMNGEMNYSRDRMTINGLSINDPCGSFYVGDLILWKDPAERWCASVPLIHITQYRPSLMDDGINTPSKIGKALVIRQMEIQDLKGILGDRNSFRGYGMMNFVNSHKRNLQHPIFAIPAEILSRIGLDLGVLTPAKGSVYYSIENGKVVFKRFKDVYSKGKLSKFYLPDNGYESYIDFDGNVHMQVKMRQYNLLFKLAELFTVNIQGTVKKPVYTLQKQTKNGYERY